MTGATQTVEKAGWAVLGTLALLAVFASVLAPYDPTALSGAPFEAPSARHWLGTNDIGQDLLSELLHATRASLVIGASAALLAIGLAVGLAMTAVLAGRASDVIVGALIDITLTVPFLAVLVLCAAHLGPSRATLVAVIAALTWARPARLLRAHLRAVLGREFIAAAYGLGARTPALVARHLLPHAWPLIVAQGVVAASQALALESSLSFLGLGDPTTKSWGSMLFYAHVRSAALTGAWLWWVVPPGLMITAAVLGTALAGMRLERDRR